jgi:hypothetical protein
MGRRARNGKKPKKERKQTGRRQLNLESKNLDDR